MAETVALLVVGNEILSGKVADRNIAAVAEAMFAVGVRLTRVVVCADDVDVIAAEVTALRAANDAVITTGGVGPTHDDLTYAGVAKALTRTLERSAELEAFIRSRFGEKTHAGHLRMAELPEGATLLRSEGGPWPVICVENVYVFPGVPDLVRMKLPLLAERLRGAAPFVSRAVLLRSDEFAIADALAGIAAAHPTVDIGSYPRWDEPRYKVKLTFDGRDAGAVDAAAEAFLASIDPAWVVDRGAIPAPTAEGRSGV